jgi:hypothetical protein
MGEQYTLILKRAGPPLRQLQGHSEYQLSASAQDPSSRLNAVVDGSGRGADTPAAATLTLDLR